jgi:hypothetical protein
MLTRARHANGDRGIILEAMILNKSLTSIWMKVCRGTIQNFVYRSEATIDVPLRQAA